MWSRMPFGEGLRAELGPPGRARRLSSSPRSRVWRVELPGGPAVVKQVVGGADAAERYAREVAAFRMAARAESPVVPAVLGTDVDERVLVLERVDHRQPAADWIVGYATALARLHAAGSPADVGRLPPWSAPTSGDAGSFIALAAALGVAVPPSVPGELAELVRRLGSLGGSALLHGDPCPGNDLHTGDGVRFIDLEQASLGNGLTELAYLRIGFPHCWCVTTAAEALVDRAETAYRTAWYFETGTEPAGDLTDACAGWLIRGDALVQRSLREGEDHLARIPRQDWKWGTVTARERLAHRLGVVAAMTAGRADLGGTSLLCEDLRGAMLARWPKLSPPPTRRP